MNLMHVKHNNYGPIRFKSALVTDKRVRIMNEVISGIRVIKMYAWENAFNKLISKLRRYVMFTCHIKALHRTGQVLVKLTRVSLWATGL